MNKELNLRNLDNEENFTQIAKEYNLNKTNIFAAKKEVDKISKKLSNLIEKELISFMEKNEVNFSIVCKIEMSNSGFTVNYLGFSTELSHIIIQLKLVNDKHRFYRLMMNTIENAIIQVKSLKDNSLKNINLTNATKPMADVAIEETSHLTVINEKEKL